MYLHIFIGFLILAIASCHSQEHKISDESVKTNTNSIAVFKSEETNVDTEELVEFFSDDSKVGLPRRNKIEISEFKKLDGNVAVINFYSLETNKEWKLKQTFEFEKDGLVDCDPKLEDFNNDGFKDMTYVSAVAARGANEVRRLFIYDKRKDELIYIKNSESYPNMQYNKELNCIDAWMFHGGTTTVFLRIDGDSLREFASVDNGINRTVYLIDKNGKEKLLRTDKIKEEDIYTRYKNFNPPESYE